LSEEARCFFSALRPRRLFEDERKCVELFKGIGKLGAKSVGNAVSFMEIIERVNEISP